MAEITDKAALATLADDDLLAIIQAGTTYRIQKSNLKKGMAGLDLQTLVLGGSGKDMSATGGANEYVKQSGVGATFTTGAIGTSDLPNASTAAAGIIQLATQTEVDNGVATTKAVTPATLQNNVSELAIIGEIRLWTKAAAPSDWQLCDGSAISRTTYANLFAIIGTTFGIGDGSTTFNIPDYRGSFPIGVGSSYVLAATGGAATHTLTTAEIPGHTHSIGNVTTNQQVNAGANTTYLNHTGGIATGSTGGGGAHENLHPYLALNYIIYAGT